LSYYNNKKDLFWTVLGGILGADVRTSLFVFLVAFIDPGLLVFGHQAPPCEFIQNASRIFFFPKHFGQQTVLDLAAPGLYFNNTRFLNAPKNLLEFVCSQLK
jgi:hypothetical protein